MMGDGGELTEPERREGLDPVEDARGRVEGDTRREVERELLLHRVRCPVGPVVGGDDATDLGHGEGGEDQGGRGLVGGWRDRLADHQG